MPLPNQEKKEVYNADEVQDIVAREVMKHRLADVEQKMVSHESATAAALGEITATLKSIERQLASNREDVHNDIENCRRDFHRDFREEVERDFATRMELQLVEGKVDRLTTKIVTAVAVIVFVIQVVFQIFG